MTNHSPVFSIVRVTVALALTLILCAPFSHAAQQPKKFPDAATVENIATQGFVYGLPIVMHYAVTYEYSVDTKSPQYKAPFNALRNGGRVFTYKDTVVITPNSDTPTPLPALTSGPNRWSLPCQRIWTGGISACSLWTPILSTLATSAAEQRATAEAAIL